MDDLPALFRAAHAAIGDEIVPPDYFGPADMEDCLSGAKDKEHSQQTDFDGFMKEAVNAGIVHTTQWLVNLHTGNVVSVSVDRIEYYDRERTQLHAPCFHDNTPPSIYAALLRLATRVAQEKTNA